ncbi:MULTISPECIES: ATP cone domain-containing protein [Lactococcus]|jgi:Oxygen-sensitive ribonucleoside-triphosphate reductase|uniref:Anaerobic ribonucleotide reductase n=7 Tax=Lactococcus TaxID=1357 RepID=F9VFN7_LACGL|nr:MULTISPECIES: ATP cone domain-containing protein [Lactococcus]ETD04144.1 ribonucleotide reductase [Lactococcus garvieae TRF1]MCA9746242.1 ribonucleotide reductase [Lactococcus sp.]EIT67369.1 Anaerobic ribonucleotide reductase [Lactococcus garvieae IPLA 31405]EKF52373.1 ATP-cone domain protein [Lactococcus garvieae DCC43]KAA8711101.1 ribonucleotide reductase [Lactococcus garvieae subsp. garvieae]
MEAKLLNKVVIKRNGRVVDWDSFRIQTAVFKAAINGKYKDKPLHANMIANNVAKVVEKVIAEIPFDKIEIDTIQNQVVNQLNDFDKEVAKDFLEYKVKQEINRKH